MPRSRAMMGTAWRKPRRRGLADLRSSILGGGGVSRGLAVWGEEEVCVQSRLDALGWCDGQERLGHAGAEAGEDCAGTRHLAVGVGEEALVLVEGDESCPSQSVLAPHLLLRT